jgi:ArsR family transcriptional regulator, arsenate/arsenite/antimonite-responsive transcriptional repressor
VENDKLVRVLKALSDPKRFRMVQEIAAAGELSCGQIGEKFPLSQPTISHHLKILSEAGILVARQEAQHHFISVNQELLTEVAGLLPARLLGAQKQERRNKTERRS